MEQLYHRSLLAVGCFGLSVHSKVLKINISGKFSIDRSIVKNAIYIAFPMALEHTAVCGAMICVTRIIAPLGTIAIAENSFAVTTESLCYMPGYGIATAATTSNYRSK